MVSVIKGCMMLAVFLTTFRLLLYRAIFLILMPECFSSSIKIICSSDTLILTILSNSIFYC
jgi:hypothetical protein